MAKKSTTRAAGTRRAATKTVRKTTKKSTTRVSRTKPAKAAAKVTVGSSNGHGNGEAKPLLKSHLSKKELNQYRTLLLTKRAEILGDMTSMSREALQDSANLSHMPIHMADVGSENYEQELMLGLVESERRLVQEINDALGRIADGTFGMCQVSQKPINKERLQAKPWAKYCIEVAREMERSGRGGY